MRLARSGSGLLALLLFICMCSPAFAGAWPRGKGKVFVSNSAFMTWPKGRALKYPDIYGAAYVEYGIMPRLTLGLDLGSSNAKRLDALKAVGFLRYSISEHEAPHQFAIDLGIGQNLGNRVIRMGLGYGAGFKLGRTPAWIAVDYVMLAEPRNKKRTQSLDATLGLSLRAAKLIGQINAYEGSDRQQSLSVTASYLHPIGKSRQIEIGAVLGIKNKPYPALKVGIWQEF